MLHEYQYSAGPVAGCDEAGRGCLAGPVVAAAVILPEGFYHPLLNDSKKMRESDRELVRKVIEKEALAWAIGSASVAEIDRINILNASILAMHRAIESLTIKPALLLIDGNRFHPVKGIAHECVVGGDGLYLNIAAASVIAKTERDRLMVRLHLKYPHYGWDQNKAYATLKHRRAIVQYGTCPHHRKSFNTSFQLSFEF